MNVSYRRDKRRKGKTRTPPGRMQSICPNCGHLGSHFIPPSLGETGFYVCKTYCQECLNVRGLNVPVEIDNRVYESTISYTAFDGSTQHAAVNILENFGYGVDIETKTPTVAYWMDEAKIWVQVNPGQIIGSVAIDVDKEVSNESS